MNPHNFGCITASDSLLDSTGWVFGVKLFDDDIAEIEGLRDVAMATNFWTTLAVHHVDGCKFCQLSSNIESL